LPYAWFPAPFIPFTPSSQPPHCCVFFMKHFSLQTVSLEGLSYPLLMLTEGRTDLSAFTFSSPLGLGLQPLACTASLNCKTVIFCPRVTLAVFHFLPLTVEVVFCRVVTLAMMSLFSFSFFFCFSFAFPFPVTPPLVCLLVTHPVG